MSTRREQSTGFFAKLYDHYFRNAVGEGVRIDPHPRPRYENRRARARIYVKSLRRSLALGHDDILAKVA